MAIRHIKKLTNEINICSNKSINYSSNNTVSLSSREWQVEAWKSLYKKRYRRLIAPMGSGKSTLTKALKHYDYTKGNKILIAVPQTIIGERSFINASTITLPDKSKFNWMVGHNLLNNDDIIDRLISFINEPIGTFRRSVGVCTHQALVLANQKNIKWNTGGPISLTIDEAHRVALEDNESDATVNCLGAFIKNYIANNYGPIDLVTATWMRADLIKIIDDTKLSNFTTYNLPFYKYLTTTGIQKINFTYMIGDTPDIIKETHTSETKSFVFMRQTAAGKIEDKYTRVKEYTKALKSNLKFVDLVTEKGRPQRKDLLLKAIDTNKAEPNMVLSIHIGKLGFDWPACNAVIIDQQRNSLTELLQMMGRSLRSYNNKTIVNIINMLEPLNRDDLNYESKLKDYIKVLMGSMVSEWQFSLPKFPKNASKREIKAIEDFQSDLEANSKLIGEITDRQISGLITDNEDLNNIISNFLSTHRPMLDQKQREAIAFSVRDLINSKSNRYKNVLNANDIDYDPILKHDISNLIERYSCFIDPDALKAVRNKLPPIPYNTLSKIVFNLGWKKQKQYHDNYEQIPGAPPHPPVTYKKVWTSWREFFANQRNIAGIAHLSRRKKTC